MSFLWGAIVGTASPIPYFYSLFFITVLVHRCGRDFERCVHVPLARLSHKLTTVLQLRDQVRERLGAVLLHCQV